MTHDTPTRSDNSDAENVHALEAYDFETSDDCVAARPLPVRSASRLLVIDRNAPLEACLQDRMTRDLPSLLPPGALLVVNDTKVTPARLQGKRETGGAVEFLLLTPPPCLEPQPSTSLDGKPGWSAAEAEGLVRSSKALKPGEKVRLGEGLQVEMRERMEYGRSRVLLHWRGDLVRLMETHGAPPLPPYLGRQADAEDIARYQTAFADDAKAGSVAAPTAGLHFDDALRNALAAHGVEMAAVSLYVGYGTFSPVRAEDIRHHVMHAEYAAVDEPTAAAVTRAKAEGRPVIPVGTTSLRTLEGVAARRGAVEPFAGWIDLYIRPPYTPRVATGLFTNFHQPRSSLFILVCALAGRRRMRHAYAHAQAAGYRFYSYGDATLIL